MALPSWGAAQHHFRLIDGTSVYLGADAPPLLVALHRVAEGGWYLEQMAGPRNEAPPPGTQAALLKGLAAAGLRVVSADPQSALGRLQQRARSGRAADGGEPDPGDGDDDLDGIAA